MSFADAYLEKVSLDPFIDKQFPGKDLAIVVAIPACNEPDILKTISSLFHCRRPGGAVEIIIIINDAESAAPDVLSQNSLTEKELLDYARTHQREGLRMLISRRSGIPDRDAGAGLARKMAMDHALSRFNHLNRPDGIILSLDADTTCGEGYLAEVAHQFRDHPDTKGCSIRFEHPIEGSTFPESVYNGITQYELHLRYYIQALRYAGHPHAYHTVGSAFGVRADVYAAQGGMNKRKAGEDFYFLQKIIPLGGFYEINTTRVMPSPRPSDRVGFGTGPVIGKFQRGETAELKTYHPDVFSDLKEFLSSVPSLYTANQQSWQLVLENYPAAVRAYIQHEFISRMEEIRRNSARESTFIKRFYRWFNMFRTLKYMNYAHQHHYSRITVLAAAREFISRTDPGFQPAGNAKDLLLYLREIQKG
ncbi:MAG: hypothetical protein AMS26_06520 [Bacteroides sp. SM23_62]|nr:MAG: hypothetical protein AMS26_06520 [Bacteroides sp. SM23_62]